MSTANQLAFQIDVPFGAWNLKVQPGDRLVLSDKCAATRVVTCAVLDHNTSPGPSVVTISWSPNPGETRTIEIARLEANGVESCPLNYPLCANVKWQVSVSGSSAVHITGHLLLPTTMYYKDPAKRPADTSNVDSEHTMKRPKTD